MYKKKIWVILSFDPSGDYSHKGKGHTGIVRLVYDIENKIIKQVDPLTIKASKYNSKKDYYSAILKIIDKVNYDFLVVENYKVAEGNATTETSELIGVIEYTAKKVFKQWNHEIKQTRFKEQNLINRGIIEKVNHHYLINNKKIDGHGRDALRHALKFISKSTGHALKEMRVSWKIKN